MSLTDSTIEPAGKYKKCSPKWVLVKSIVFAEVATVKKISASRESTHPKMLPLSRSTLEAKHQ